MPPEWLTADGVCDIIEGILEGTAERFLVRDRGLLESACGAPQNAYYYGHVEDLVDLGVTLAFAIAKNHPFEQGNKRAAFSAMVAFLQENGLVLVLADDVDYAEDFVKLVTGEVDAETYAKGLHALPA